MQSDINIKQHAINYIRDIASLMGDTNPTNNMRMLPFESLDQLYEQYLISHKVAGRKMFKMAFQELKSEIRLEGNKAPTGFMNIIICKTKSTKLVI
jgi:hypothetical protein